MAARMMFLAIAAMLAVPGTAASLPDPTALPRVISKDEPGAQDASVLSWVRVDGKKSIAWYGGTTVKLGEAVNGGRVTAILEDHIVISGKDGRRAVYLLDPAVKKQPWVPSRPARKNQE